jgi:hypothetical protein
VILDVVAILFRDLILKLFDPFVIELDYIPGLQANHVIVMCTVRHFENRSAALEIVPRHQSRTFELR